MLDSSSHKASKLLGNHIFRCENIKKLSLSFYVCIIVSDVVT